MTERASIVLIRYKFSINRCYLRSTTS